jgi:hypothetical protein
MGYGVKNYERGRRAPPPLCALGGVGGHTWARVCTDMHPVRRATKLVESLDPTSRAGRLRAPHTRSTRIEAEHLRHVT